MNVENPARREFANISTATLQYLDLGVLASVTLSSPEHISELCTPKLRCVEIPANIGVQLEVL